MTQKYNLIPNVRFAPFPPFPPKFGSRSRLQMYAGTEPSDPDLFHPKTFVPRGPLVDVPLEESELISVAEVEQSDRSMVNVVKVPTSLQATFAPAAKLLIGRAEYYSIGKTEQERHIYESTKILGYKFATRFVNTAETPLLRCEGFSIRSPNLITSTYDPSTDKYVGLHVDTNFEVTLSARRRSPPRLCINLTGECRHLLLVAMTVSKCYESLIADGCNDERISDTEFGLAQVFFETFPDFPVYQLTIAPGEAYIAPTENMFHDGSTVDRTSADVSLIFFGDFLPAKMPRYGNTT